MAEHLAQHTDFDRQLHEIVALFARKGASATVVLSMNDLLKWLVRHIGTVDTKLAGFLGEARTTVAF
jgi:hemerythrin